MFYIFFFFFFSSRRRHTRSDRDWSSDVCSSDLTDTHTASFTPNGAGFVGTFSLGPVSDSTGGVTGHVQWTFTVADGALDFLSAGETLVQSYNVTVADNRGGTVTQVVTLTFTGTNDLPVITSTAAAAAGSVTELPAVTGSTAVDTTTGT